MMYSLDLSKWSLYPDAESLVAAYIVRLTKGKYLPEHHKVLHPKIISKINQTKILAYVEAVKDTNFVAL